MKLFHHGSKREWPCEMPMNIRYYIKLKYPDLSGKNKQEVQKSIIVASIKADYHKQLKHPSSIIIGQKISRIGNTSFDISFGIFLDCNTKHPIATGIVTCVCFDYMQNIPVPVYSAIKDDYKK